jgi:hypothetical protein
MALTIGPIHGLTVKICQIKNTASSNGLENIGI